MIVNNNKDHVNSSTQHIAKIRPRLSDLPFKTPRRFRKFLQRQYFDG